MLDRLLHRGESFSTGRYRKVLPAEKGMLVTWLAAQKQEWQNVPDHDPVRGDVRGIRQERTHTLNGLILGLGRNQVDTFTLQTTVEEALGYLVCEIDLYRQRVIGGEVYSLQERQSLTSRAKCALEVMETVDVIEALRWRDKLNSL